MKRNSSLSSAVSRKCWGKSKLLKKLLLQGKMGNLEVVPQKRGISSSHGTIAFTEREREWNFWARLKVEENGCWTWIGALGAAGYGSIRWPGQQRTSRVAWLLTRGGSIKPTDLICHDCDNPPCCRPDHLFKGTNDDNMKDMVKKGRSRSLSGEESRRSKMTWKIVKKLRKLYSTNNLKNVKEVASNIGISTATIYTMLRGETWIEE